MAQSLDRSILLKILLETRLETDAFGPLIDFLRFRVQNLLI